MLLYVLKLMLGKGLRAYTEDEFYLKMKNLEEGRNSQLSYIIVE
jgi:hypothetical protein